MGRVPSRGSDQFIIRFPDGMRDALKADAAGNGRSLNAEIVHRLESYSALIDQAEKLDGDVRELKGLLIAANRERAHEELNANALKDRLSAVHTQKDELEQKARILSAEVERLTEQRNDAVNTEHAIAGQLREAQARLADFESSLSPNLRERLEKAAKASKRTLAGEIAYRVEASFSELSGKSTPPALTPEAFDAMLAPRLDQAIDTAVESAFRRYVRERNERERKD